MEPEALVQCPYDRSHQVRVSRLPYHLVRCQQPRHLLPRQAPAPAAPRYAPPPPGCPQPCPPLSAVPSVPADPQDAAWTAPEPPRAWQPPPCREDWDAELSELQLEDPPPFVLRVTNGDLPVP
ncbi:GTSF1 factor, partial [Daphoenositta chrysoptera]|nr:GTSF1 factor [Daphoenositta chrysoptera]